MKLIISLLVYNQLEVTKKCIESILKNSTSDYQLIISDNDSREDTQKYLSSLKDTRIKYIRNEENLGFIKAHNNVFNSTISKYFCVLNNDLIIKTKGWDSHLIDLLETHQKLAQIGNKQDLGYIGDDGVGQSRKGRRIDYIGGSCFIANRQYVIRSGGLFEDKYMQFAFCEDADLSLRLRNAGYSIAECLDINILHFHNQTFKHEKVDIDFKSLEKKNNLFLQDRWRKYLKKRNFEPMKILVDRQGALGDCLCTEPIIRELKNKYPQGKIYVDTSCPNAFLNNPDIAVYGKGIKYKFEYDMVIDLNGAYEANPQMHVVDAYAKKAKVIIYPDELIPRYYGLLSNQEKLKKTIVVCSDNTWKNRMWDLKLWKQFIEHITKKYNYTVLEVGIHPENYLGIGQNFIGKLIFPNVVNLIYRSEMFLGFDSGLIHFAQAVGTPIFSIFGCIDPHYRIHDWDKATVVWLNHHELECAGCHHKKKAPVTFSQCERDKIYCLENITLDRVINTFERTIK